MFLLIDTSEYKQIYLAVFDNKEIKHKIYTNKNCELLNCIHKFLNFKSAICNLQSKIEGIMVVFGAGSFTSTRIACVVANTFAYALQIPLLAIKKDDVEKVQKLIPKLLKQKPGHYLSATYSGEPNITLPKKK